MRIDIAFTVQEIVALLARTPRMKDRHMAQAELLIEDGAWRVVLTTFDTRAAVVRFQSGDTSADDAPKPPAPVGDQPESLEGEPHGGK